MHVYVYVCAYICGFVEERMFMFVGICDCLCIYFCVCFSVILVLQYDFTWPVDPQHQLSVDKVLFIILPLHLCFGVLALFRFLLKQGSSFRSIYCPIFCLYTTGNYNIILTHTGTHTDPHIHTVSLAISVTYKKTFLDSY